MSGYDCALHLSVCRLISLYEWVCLQTLPTKISKYTFQPIRYSVNVLLPRPHRATQTTVYLFAYGRYRCPVGFKCWYTFPQGLFKTIYNYFEHFIQKKSLGTVTLIVFLKAKKVRYINLEPEEVPVKAAPTFSKGWNAENCCSDNQRQHDVVSSEGSVLEITDRYTYS